MKSRTSTIFVLLSTALLFGSGSAWSWGSDGHKTIGAIADQLLADTPTQTKLKALLQAGETLQSVSVWADCAKGFTYCQKAPTDEMKSFTDGNPDHHGYHYTDVPYQSEGYSAGTVGTTDHDVVVTIQQCIAALQAATSGPKNPHAFTPRQAVLLLAHLVGDIHQPLHVGAAYLTASGQAVEPSEQDLKDGVALETQGGNKLHINGTTRVLHGYWDGDAVKVLMRRKAVKTPTDLASALLETDAAPEVLRGNLNQKVVDWANESLDAAKQAFHGVGISEQRTDYPTQNGGTTNGWDVSLPRLYPKSASDIAADRLLAAGKRLAGLLAAVVK